MTFWYLSYNVISFFMGGREETSWSYGSWIYIYLWNQCLSPLTLWIRIPLRWGVKKNVLDTTLCDKVCQWLAAGRWFSLCTPVSSTNKTNRHGMTEILLKVASNTLTHTHTPIVMCPFSTRHSDENRIMRTVKEIKDRM